MKKITHLKSLSFLITCFCVVSFGFGQIITFDFNGLAGNEGSANSNSNDPNLTTSTITRGSGLTASAKGDRFNAINWATASIANAVSGDDYMEFTITPNSGYRFNITTIVVNFQRSPAGTRGIALRNSIDTYANNIDTEKAIADNASSQVFTFNVSQVNSSTAVTYRIYGWAEDTSGTGGFEGSGNDIIVNGVVSALPVCPTSTTYTLLSGWSNGLPNSLTKAVIINDSYDTSAGDIIACDLTVSNNATLNVADNSSIEVQNDITVDTDSSIIVQPQGAVVQIDDSGAVTNNGTMTVTKRTAPANAWYEYTYWSSPVSGADIANGLTESQVGRRFVFNAQNFLDATAETSNNNIPLAGQDDIDDNGDDWQAVGSSTIMTSGVGYASTHDKTLFSIGPGNQFDYTFDGPFNNGVIDVPVYRNDSELLDYNWNFVGNPYPSAINADLFLAANTNIATDVITVKSIDGAIFLWSQNTLPSSTANGNQQLNFTNDDFAIINAVGQSAGGDGITPTRFIPSGQGFFVSMSNSAPATVVLGTVYKADVDVTFNNSMRVKGATDNSQFFKNSNTKKASNATVNKIWIDLTSDNGVFNQILVGYVNGATNDDDGISYDTVKFPTKGAALYSTIEGSNKKFTIQGKNPNSINEDEIINLGFKTTIDVPTLYKLSVAQLQGAFLTNNTVYLKDNLLNKSHDLSASDYTFTSDPGEFNDRFEIVFNAAALSTNNVSVEENQFSIVNLDNNRVQFNTNNSLNIKTISVFDLIGRQLYYLKGNSNSETYTLSNLNNSVYIAKVELSNGSVITKKAIK